MASRLRFGVYKPSTVNPKPPLNAVGYVAAPPFRAYHADGNKLGQTVCWLRHVILTVILVLSEFLTYWGEVSIFIIQVSHRPRTVNLAWHVRVVRAYTPLNTKP